MRALLLLWLATVALATVLLVDKYGPHDSTVTVDPTRYVIGTTTPDWDGVVLGRTVRPA